MGFSAAPAPASREDPVAPAPAIWPWVAEENLIAAPRSSRDQLRAISSTRRSTRLLIVRLQV